MAQEMSEEHFIPAIDNFVEAKKDEVKVVQCLSLINIASVIWAWKKEKSKYLSWFGNVEIIEQIWSCD